MEKSGRPVYITVFKSIAFASFTLGLCLLSVCFWVLISLSESEHENASENPTALKFRLITIIGRQQSRSRSVENTSINYYDRNRTNETKGLENSIQKFKASWDSVAPYFQGSCGLAVILGLIQVITCMVILSSSRKGAIKPLRFKVWKFVHLGLAVFLLLCAFIPVTIDKSKNDGGIRNHLEEMAKQIKKFEPKNRIHVEGVDNMTLLYCTLIADGVTLIVLVTFAHLVLMCLSRRIGKPEGQT